MIPMHYCQLVNSLCLYFTTDRQEVKQAKTIPQTNQIQGIGANSMLKSGLKKDNWQQL
jgi:hypothetical protein